MRRSLWLLIFIGAFAADIDSTFAVCGDPPGNVNGDTFTNVVDVQCAIVGAIWELGGNIDPAPECLGLDIASGDLNCDGFLNVTDIQIVINHTIGAPLAASIDGDADGCVDTCTQGDCCTIHPQPGCADFLCETLVCSADSFCCEVSWDGVCATEAGSLCGSLCEPATGDGTDCCAEKLTPECSNPECVDCVCALDDFCCVIQWDDLCAGEAVGGCGAVCPCGPPPPICGDGFCESGENCGESDVCLSDCGGCPCIIGVQCTEQCAPGDMLCIDQCLAQLEETELTQAQALLTCSAAFGCDLLPPGTTRLLCWTDHCSSETVACNGQPASGPTCADAVNCTLACFEDPGCIEICLAGTSPDQAPAALDLYNCIIATNCIEITGGGPDFMPCIQSTCSAEILTCVPPPPPGPTCVDGVNCALQCGLAGPACIDPCLALTDPAALPPTVALIDCLVANECNLVASQQEFDMCVADFCLLEGQNCLNAVSPVCGDGSCEPFEVCGAPFPCEADCGPCIPPGDNNCCEPSAGDSPGCDLDVCENCVCGADSFCCEVTWDSACSGLAKTLCRNACPQCEAEPGSCTSGFVCILNCDGNFSCINGCASLVDPSQQQLVSQLALCGLSKGCNPLGPADTFAQCAYSQCTNQFVDCTNGL